MICVVGGGVVRKNFEEKCGRGVLNLVFFRATRFVLKYSILVVLCRTLFSLFCYCLRVCGDSAAMLDGENSFLVCRVTELYNFGNIVLVA